MKKILTVAPLVLALAAVAMPAAARDEHRYGHRDRHSYGHDRDERRAYFRGYRDGRHDDHWEDHARRYHWRSVHWDNGRRGPPPWARGRDYRSYGYGRVYYVPVSHYGRYGLYRPRYGYRWVRDDHDNFLLVAATTGIIASILLDHAY
jgi:Ni/Co efflux regulator RcnB